LTVGAELAWVTEYTLKLIMSLLFRSVLEGPSRVRVVPDEREHRSCAVGPEEERPECDTGVDVVVVEIDARVVAVEPKGRSMGEGGIRSWEEATSRDGNAPG
jgi:hypothetical protein